MFAETFILNAGDTSHLSDATGPESCVRTMKKLKLVSLAPENNLWKQWKQPVTWSLTLLRNQVKQIGENKPEVTDSKLGALFHAAKVRVGASHGPIVAKDSGEWIEISEECYQQVYLGQVLPGPGVIPAHDQSFVVVPRVVADWPPVNENTSFIKKVSNLGWWMLQNYLS